MPQAALDYSSLIPPRAYRYAARLQLTTSGPSVGGLGRSAQWCFLAGRVADTNNSRERRANLCESDLVRTTPTPLAQDPQLEPSIELNLPLVTGQEGNQPAVDQWYVPVWYYYVKGGAGTTGEDATQELPPWRLSPNSRH